MTLFCLGFLILHTLMSILLTIFVLPLFGLLSGVKPRLTLLALVIPYSGNPMYEMTLFLALALLTQLKAHFVTPFRDAVRGKASLEIAGIVHLVIIEPQ